MTRPTTEDRFWAKVDKNGPLPPIRPDLGPCWLWKGKLTRKGYAQFSIKNGYPGHPQGWEPVAAHRFAYELQVGPIPDGLCIDHLCFVRHCMNGAHLEAVTLAVNTLRSNSPTMLLHRANRCAKGHDLTVHGYNRPTGTGRFCRTCQAERARTGSTLA